MSTEPRRLPAAAYIAAMVLALAGVVGGVVSNQSESALVSLSYLCVPLFVFGVVGLVCGRRLKPALLWAIVALVALFNFLVVIFPML